MSTTETGTAEAPDTNHQTDERLRRDRERYGEYRSLMRVSIQNEAEGCETAADCRWYIQEEMRRENPRGWVIARFNKRMQEVEGDA